MMLTKLHKREKALIVIQRHWIWADRIRDEYFERLKANPPTNTDLVEFFLIINSLEDQANAVFSAFRPRLIPFPSQFRFPCSL
jgi:hypothetical protein